MTGMLFAGTGSDGMMGVAAGMCMAGALGQNNAASDNTYQSNAYQNFSGGRTGFFDGACINATLIGWAGRLEAEKREAEAAGKSLDEAEAEKAEPEEAVKAVEEAEEAAIEEDSPESPEETITEDSEASDSD